MLLQSLLRPVLTPLMRGMFDAPIASSAAWSPLALWPDGIATPGMWISPRALTSQWQDYLGTTPVAVPGTVADSSNPVGLALDIRTGNPPPLGPELVTNGDFSDGTTGFTAYSGSTMSVSGGVLRCTRDATNGDSGIQFDVPGLIAGRTYWIEFDIVAFSGVSGANIAYLPPLEYNTTGLGHKKALFTFAGGSTNILCRTTGAGPAGSYVEYDNISVREIAGNHATQATAAARPVVSARVNMHTQTEVMTVANGWIAGGSVVVSDPDVPPGSSATASSQITADNQYEGPYQTVLTVGVTYTKSVWLKGAVGGEVVGITDNANTGGTVTVTAEWAQYTKTWVAADTGSPILISSVGGGVVYAADVQVELGSTATPYQRVTTDSDYDASVAPTYLKFDGVDDGMATAAFAAGTLTSGMDCMIAVRRDSAAATYLISDTASRGFFEWESGDTDRPDVSAGTPTYYVDGVACTATRGALFTALTAGDWHILEARGLDLSTWLKVEVSSLVSYRLNGPSGDILLYPSTASTEDKDAARQWLADYYGVTLP